MRFLCALIVLCFSLTAFSQSRVRENIKQMTYTDSQVGTTAPAETAPKKPEPSKKTQPAPKK